MVRFGIIKVALYELQNMTCNIYQYTSGYFTLTSDLQAFFWNARSRLTDDHIWLSVFSRPCYSVFTRCQRASCCVSILFLTMITNAMWYQSSDVENDQVITRLKPERLDSHSCNYSQVVITFASAFGVVRFLPVKRG